MVGQISHSAVSKSFRGLGGGHQLGWEDISSANSLIGKRKCWLYIGYNHCRVFYIIQEPRERSAYITLITNILTLNRFFMNFALFIGPLATV